MKKANIFEVNIKKYDMGAIIMTMIDELTEPEIMKPTPFTGTGPIEIEICELRIAQYINNHQKLENECKNSTL
jgi:hypothetical protein